MISPEFELSRHRIAIKTVTVLATCSLQLLVGRGIILLQEYYQDCKGCDLRNYYSAHGNIALVWTLIFKVAFWDIHIDSDR